MPAMVLPSRVIAKVLVNLPLMYDQYFCIMLKLVKNISIAILSQLLESRDNRVLKIIVE